MTLKKLVYKFRNAIERAKDNNEPGEFFRKFPIGQCGNTSDMLAQYLIENHIGPIELVSGIYYADDPNYPDDRQSHAWLLVKGVIIDITCDQFKFHNTPLKCDNPIYIGPMSDYYRQFDTSHAEIYWHQGLDKNWPHYNQLRSTYETIKRYL
ncbi:hypothetical protein ODJ80_05090 [Acutalibacter sp. LFL-21]|uniref:hypothetical protein n=1 Tax=Acutalibacter sp. LFL-21 TaxID=2983399 RepID=UPI0021D66C0F|nr:hypothetical protein [Acutalibacter sp. LFL-21]MCU7652182.1 hypothetical protein [Acutalibacter sp. LFL-21]